jgi:hypothetical protein
MELFFQVEINFSFWSIYRFLYTRRREKGDLRNKKFKGRKATEVGDVRTKEKI